MLNNPENINNRSVTKNSLKYIAPLAGLALLGLGGVAGYISGVKEAVKAQGIINERNLQTARNTCSDQMAQLSRKTGEFVEVRALAAQLDRDSIESLFLESGRQTEELYVLPISQLYYSIHMTTSGQKIQCINGFQQNENTGQLIIDLGEEKCSTLPTPSEELGPSPPVPPLQGNALPPSTI